MPTESERLRAALDEAATVHLIFASGAGEPDSRIEPAFARAELVKGFTPATWRTFWIRRPDDLDDDLKQALWGAGEPGPVTLLCLGTGLARTRAAFALDDLHDELAIAGVFAHDCG